MVTENQTPKKSRSTPKTKIKISTKQGKNQAKNKLLYTRAVDGLRPVTPGPTGTYILDNKEHTKTSLLRALGRSGWSFDRYFRVGVYAPPSRETFMLPRLGVDLETRAGEVAKLLYAGFGQWMFSCGYDPEDVLQEVYRGLLTRNQGKCPWDETKSSFGHYVHMVCRGVLSNYHRKRQRERERRGTVRGYGEGDYGEMDVGASRTLSAPRSAYHEESTMRETLAAVREQLAALGKGGEVAADLLPLVREGWSRAEMAEKLGISHAAVSRGIGFLKSEVRNCV